MALPEIVMSKRNVARLDIDPSTLLPSINSFGDLSQFLRAAVADEDSMQLGESMGVLASHIEAVIAQLRLARHRATIAPMLMDLLTVLRGHHGAVVALNKSWRGLYEYASYLAALNNFRVLIGQWLLDGGRHGEVLGITGLLDSGRNELALALSGVHPATSGEVRLEGQSVQIRNPRDAIKLGLGYVPEDRLTEGLFLTKPIRENIVVTVIDTLLKGIQLNFATMTAKAVQFVKDLQIATPNVDLPVSSLSGGNQQRVMVARWLATKPKVLMLHGPTAGVDVGSKDALYKLVQRLAEGGMGVVIVSDDLPELLMNTDRILVMKKGRIAKEFTTAHLEKDLLTQTLLSEDSSVAQ